MIFHYIIGEGFFERRTHEKSATLQYLQILKCHRLRDWRRGELAMFLDDVSNQKNDNIFDHFSFPISNKDSNTTACCAHRDAVMKQHQQQQQTTSNNNKTSHSDNTQAVVLSREGESKK